MSFTKCSLFSPTDTKMHGFRNLAYIILIWIFSPIYCSIANCPIDDNDQQGPCECLSPFGQVFFVCSGVKNHLQIQEAMEKMEGLHVTEFILRDSDLKYIPYNLFANASLNRIKIFNSKLFYLFDRSLEGNIENTLKEVVLEDVSFDGGLDWNVFENLRSLELFSSQRVDIYQIPPTVQKLKLPIETLFLSNASLMLIYDGVFENFKNLKNLKLDQNELKSFSRSLLPRPITKLQHLDLSYNKFSTLPEDMFEGTPHLSSLILKGNSFYILHEDFVSKIWNQLFYFDISENPLNCDCYIRWIVKRERPFHLFGNCASTSVIQSKSLKMLEEEDFIHCD